MNTKLQKAVLRCKSVLSLPSIYQKISIKIDQPQTTNNELAEIIKLDAGVSSKLLAIVNSAFYGFPSQISSISHAISIVGLKDFKNLVLGASVVKQFEEVKTSGFSMDEFWDHSLFCAIAAKHLGQHWASKQDQEELFIAGLLHNVGQLVMLKAFSKEIDKLQSLWSQGDIELERSAAGFDHAEAGAELISSWGLPQLLSDCARFHNALPKEGSVTNESVNIESAVICVFMANALSRDTEEDTEETLSICNELRKTQVSLEEMKAIREQAQEEKNTLIGVYLSKK